MSSYIKNTLNPKTKQFEGAFWLDDYYAPRRFAVMFQDGSVYDPARTKMTTDDKPHKLTWDDYPRAFDKAHEHKRRV